ncbi:DUF2809 domain-containing protein [Paeniglutamicibacter sp. MACA_103]|uniref:DUF2809 domain-containing protein n=1 Tax=Paeniglutamicibacter sp. MACA_103 TaxID=3377337 RepID=UPI003893B3FF
MTRTRSRRLAAIACVPPVIALGLAARFLGAGLPADLAGGVLYAVLVYVLLTFLRPRASAWSNAAIALVLCVLVELLQLTGIPADLARAFWPVRLVLGTGFAPLDLPAYAIGSALALGADVLQGRIRDRRPTAS